jgi:voltage-gated potassium channel Kch
MDASPGFQYIYSIYWSMQTLTTVGYGDIGAITVGEKILSLIWMFFGVGFYSFTIGNLSSIIAKIDEKAADL